MKTSEMTDTERLAAIAARHAATTPGVWHVGDGSYELVCDHPIYSNVTGRLLSVNDGRAEFDSESDAEFAAYSHQDVPWLLAMIERMTAERNGTKYPGLCTGCASPFFGVNAQQKWCSPKCFNTYRTRRYRAKKKAAIISRDLMTVPS